MFQFSFAQRPGTYEYTQDQLRTSLEGALSAREAVLRQLTNKDKNGKVVYQVDAEGQFILDREDNKIPQPNGFLEVANANSAPKDLIQLLQSTIAAIRSEIAILDKCTNNFPIKDADIARCLADLQRSSQVIVTTLNQAIPKLQETIKTVQEAWGIIVGGDAGRKQKLNALMPVLKLAQEQKNAVNATAAQWQRYAQGTLVVPQPMPKPDEPTAVDEPSPPSPFAPPDEPMPVPPSPATAEDLFEWLKNIIHRATAPAKPAMPTNSNSSATTPPKPSAPSVPTPPPQGQPVVIPKIKPSDIPKKPPKLPIDSSVPRKITPEDIPSRGMQ